MSATSVRWGWAQLCLPLSAVSWAPSLAVVDFHHDDWWLKSSTVSEVCRAMEWDMNGGTVCCHLTLKSTQSSLSLESERFTRPYLNTAVSGAPLHCLKDELTNNNSVYLISASSWLTWDPLCKSGDLQVTTRNSNDVPHWKPCEPCSNSQ